MSANSPPEQQEGWPRHQEEAAKLLEGADGVVWSRKFLATPPRLRELRWLRNFVLIAHPPLLLLRRGAIDPLNCPLTTYSHIGI